MISFVIQTNNNSTKLGELKLNITIVKPIDQIINFKQYQDSVHISDKDNSTTDLFAPIYVGQ